MENQTKILKQISDIEDYADLLKERIVALKIEMSKTKTQKKIQKENAKNIEVEKALNKRRLFIIRKSGQ
jgi:hypothetical protein